MVSSVVGENPMKMNFLESILNEMLKTQNYKYLRLCADNKTGKYFGRATGTGIITLLLGPLARRPRSHIVSLNVCIF